MVDINTVEEVEAEDYTVRVGRHESGAWEAVVLSDGDSGGGGGLRGMRTPFGVMATVSAGDDDDPDPIGPPVTAPHRWVAVGFAIEAHEWRQAGGEAVSVEEGYKRVESVDLDADLSDALTQQFAGEALSKTHTGSWQFDLTGEREDDGEGDDE